MSLAARAAFCRQSGWLALATCVGGLFLVSVHTIARRMGAGEYSDFFVLVRVYIGLGVPGVALQTLCAKQTAASMTQEARGELGSAIRAIFKFILVLWAVLAVIAFSSNKIVSSWLKVTRPSALCLTVALGLAALWIPVLKGVLQGDHDFRSLGLLQVLDGVVRFVCMILVVGVLHGNSTGAISAVGLGQLSILLVAAWHTRWVWMNARSTPFEWRRWLGRFVGISGALGSITLMSGIDILFVKSVFTSEHEKTLYLGAALAGFALTLFVGPITTVMFPRIVRSVTLRQSNDSLALALVLITSFAAGAAILYSLRPEWPLRLIYMTSPEMWKGVPLVPWFAWMLIPLMLASVLIQDLLASERFAAVPWLLSVVVLYALCLWVQKPTLVNLPDMDAFRRVVQTMGLANVVFLGVTVGFSMGRNSP